MATYVNDLRLKEIATGDESGTWGTSTNTNLELIAEAFSFGTEAITTNADTHTTTIADGSTDPGRSLYLKYTGTLDSACTITIGPNTVSKLWFIENGTSGSQNIIISQGSGANVTIPAGHVKAVYSDGAGSGAAIVDAFTDLNLAGTTTIDVLSASGNATIGGTLGVTGIVTLTDDLIIGDGKTIGSASDVDAMTIASNGQVTFSQNIIGTLGTAAQTNITSLGTLTTLTVDEITINGDTITATDDFIIDVTDDITLDADGGDIFFKDGGTQKMHLDGTGRLLIGADSGDAFNDDAMLRLQRTGDRIFQSFKVDADQEAAIFFGDVDDDIECGIQYQAASKNLIFSTGNNSEAVRIDSSGNFMVGTTTAIDSDSGRGNISLNGSSAAMFNLGVGGSQKGYFFHNGSFLRISNTVSDGIMQFQTNDTERMQIDSAGLITMTHVASAHTGGLTLINSQAGGFGCGLTFQSERSDNNAIVTAARIRTEGADSWNSDSTTESNIIYETCNNNSLSEKMRMTNTGRLGIGTTAPVELLHVSSGTSAACRVSGGANSNKKIEIGYDNTLGPVIRGGSSGETGIKFFVDNSTLAGKFDTNADFYTNDGTVHSLSDSRVKTDINDLIDGLDIVKQLQPKTFKYNEKSEFYSEETKDEVRYGFIADEVKEVAPQYMQVGKGKIDGVEVDDLKTLSTTKMIPMLVKAIQEQQEQIDALQSEINLLKGE